jgi:hypothetical protein
MVLPTVNQFSLSNCVVRNELAFTTKIVLSVANEHSLPKLCCLQRINIRCQNSVVGNE